MTDQPIHILAVDDNRMNRLKLARTLEGGGYSVSQADGGRAALDMLRSETFDLVLLGDRLRTFGWVELRDYVCVA